MIYKLNEITAFLKTPRKKKIYGNIPHERFIIIIFKNCCKINGFIMQWRNSTQKKQKTYQSQIFFTFCPICSPQ